MPERGECEGLFHGEDAILAAKKDGEEFARQERERRVGRRKKEKERKGKTRKERTTAGYYGRALQF